MTFSNRERRLFLAGLFALGILGVFLFRRKPRLRAIPTQKPFPLPDAAVHPSDPQLGTLRFSVDRNKKTVCAHDVATGRLVWESSGEDRFIIPELWVANVGRKRLERLDPQTGRFMASWQPTEPFGGCCNPVRFAALAGGRFVTMEKGTRRVRIYAPSGAVEQELATDLSLSEQFLRVLFGGGLLAPFLWLAGKRKSRKAAFLWQIDPDKCIQCGKCETACVLEHSAVKCVHQYAACGYCLFCSGYYQDKRVKFDTAAENLRCPTDAIKRKYIEDPYFEYTIDESACIGCGRCVKGCAAYGNGSLFLQIRQELCKQCNQCSIAEICPSHAIVRVPADQPYIFKRPPEVKT